jgi:hypothetical protein
MGKDLRGRTRWQADELVIAAEREMHFSDH